MTTLMIRKATKPTTVIYTMVTTSRMIFDISYALLKYSRYGILEIRGLGYVSGAM